MIKYLISCPFCGGEAKTEKAWDSSGNDRFRRTCQMCGAGTCYFDTKEKAEEAYAKRVETNEREWFGYCSICGKPWHFCEGCEGATEVPAALAVAPKPCEHGCVDGKVLITPARGNNYEAPCPIHGTKPEAPTELCKVCGEWRYATAHLNFRRLGTDHPFTPKDATPKDEE